MAAFSYVTLLSSDGYLPGVRVLRHSLRATGARFPLLVLVTENVSEPCRNALATAGINYRVVRRRYELPEEVRSRNPVRRWRFNAEKLRVYELTEFATVVFIDADTLVLRNPDPLFARRVLSGALHCGDIENYSVPPYPNSGVMVIPTEAGLGDRIFAAWPAVAARHDTFGDQRLLHTALENYWKNERSTWEIPVTYNCCVWLLDTILDKFRLGYSELYILHFSWRKKPWQMTRLQRTEFFLRKALRGKWAEIRAYRDYFRVLRKIR